LAPPLGVAGDFTSASWVAAFHLNISLISLATVSAHPHMNPDDTEDGMPQPILRVLGPYPEFSLTEESVVMAPELAKLMAWVVSSCSYLDTMLGRSLAELLGTTAEIGITMYQALKSSSAQDAVLRAAAAKKLTGEELDLFSILLDFMDSVTERRNKVVHGLWGFSGKRPDLLVWIPPETYLQWHLESAERERLKAMGNRGPTRAGVGLDSVMVYGEADFKSIRDRLLQVTVYFQQFWAFAGSGYDSTVEARRQLSTVKEIQTRLSHIERKRQDEPKSPARPPRKNRSP
jgi:hypothetical protein